MGPIVTQHEVKTRKAKEKKIQHLQNEPPKPPSIAVVGDMTNGPNGETSIDSSIDEFPSVLFM
jgi:hypothetical protein